MAAKKQAAKPSSPSKESQPKPGIRSTEFWLCSLCGIFSIMWGAGVIDLGPEASGSINKAAALLAGALSAMGYGISRGLAKIKK